MPANTSGPLPALCPRCRRQILPQLAQPTWHREKHRATAAEREGPHDPRAEHIRERKARKAEQRKLHRIARVEGIIAATRFFFSVKGIPWPADSASEECPDCRALQHDAAA